MASSADTSVFVAAKAVAIFSKLWFPLKIASSPLKICFLILSSHSFMIFPSTIKPFSNFSLRLKKITFPFASVAQFLVISLS